MNINEIIGGVLLTAENGDPNQLRSKLSQAILTIIKHHSLDHYTTLLLIDENLPIRDIHSDRIYTAAKNAGGTKDILLILHSNGGRIEPAYLIGKALRRLCRATFVTAVPRRAKSAATLMALGADTIHMGLTSHLGPIDPQIRGLPAQALSNALDMITAVACKYPDSSDMLANYLVKQMPMRTLGYYHRLNESAIQYAERLLSYNKSRLPKDPHAIAEHLVNHYKDHGFVIDSDEALELLGNTVVQLDTPEYLAADQIFQTLDLLSFALSNNNGPKFSYIGDIEGGMLIFPASAHDAN